MGLDYLLYKRNYIALENHRVWYIIITGQAIETKHKRIRTNSPLILISECLFINVISRNANTEYSKGGTTLGCSLALKKMYAANV